MVGMLERETEGDGGELDGRATLTASVSTVKICAMKLTES